MSKDFVAEQLKKEKANEKELFKNDDDLAFLKEDAQHLASHNHDEKGEAITLAFVKDINLDQNEELLWKGKAVLTKNNVIKSTVPVVFYVVWCVFCLLFILIPIIMKAPLFVVIVVTIIITFFFLLPLTLILFISKKQIIAKLSNTFYFLTNRRIVISYNNYLKSINLNDVYRCKIRDNNCLLVHYKKNNYSYVFNQAVLYIDDASYLADLINSFIVTHS